MSVSLICAASANGIIGADNRLPWRLPADLRRFKQLTLGHPVIMGRKTFESIGRPLPERTNIVVTRQPEYQAEGCRVAHSLTDALAMAGDDSERFVIGGAELFCQALPHAERIYLTRIHRDFDGDTHLFAIDPAVWGETAREDSPSDAEMPYSFCTLERVTHRATT